MWHPAFVIALLLFSTVNVVSFRGYVVSLHSIVHSCRYGKYILHASSLPSLNSRLSQYQLLPEVKHFALRATNIINDISSNKTQSMKALLSNQLSQQSANTSPVSTTTTATSSLTYIIPRVKGKLSATSVLFIVNLFFFLLEKIVDEESKMYLLVPPRYLIRRYPILNIGYFTAQFSHFEPFHFISNMFALVTIGPMVSMFA